jgi:CDP-diacylglycerol--serine O-phosphatidyltransferase
MLPNAVTLLGLCGGISAVRFAAAHAWPLSLGCMTVAGACDLLDGQCARALNAQSEFGAQLDSLADLVSFGVAPATIVYNWSASSAAWAWLAVLLFTGCCALRLARFNSDLRTGSSAPGYFVGLPAPGAAGLALLPLLLSLQFGEAGILRSAALNSGLLVVLAFLMVSRLPTLKVVTPARKAGTVIPALLLVALIATRWPWGVASVGLLLYALSLPFGLAIARRRGR